MKGGKRPLGYTLIEVMIVLAVSGLLFVIAANFISGKQGKASFQQGSNELVSRLQSIIEEVTDGQYADVPMTCSATGPQVNLAAGGVQNQGTQSQCVFLGKLVHFTTRTDDANKYEIYPLVGARLKSDGSLVTALADTKLSPAIGSGGLNLTSQANIPQNIYINPVGIRLTSATGVTTTTRSGFGFMQGLGSSRTLADGSVISDPGYQTVSLIYNDSGAMHESSQIPFPAAASQITAATVKLAKSAALCITDGIRYARITVGPDVTATTQSQLHVAIKQLGESSASCP